MRRHHLWLRFALAVVAAGILVHPPCVQAATIFIDSPTFVAGLQPGYYLESFDSLTAEPLPNPIIFSSGGFSYSASAPGGFFPVATSGDWVLSTTFPTDPITLTFTSGNVTAVGGHFFATDLVGNVTSGTITLNLSDGSSVTLTNPAASSFIGFMTEVPITSLVIAAENEGAPYKYPTADDLYVGSTVPEPSSAILVAAGGLLLAGLRSRFRRR
jgi:hypothetical protein